MRNHKFTLALATGMAGLALVTAGCSGSDGGGVKKSDSSGGTSSSGGDSAAMDNAQKLRSCLRGKGMDVPDLKPGSNPYAQSLAAPAGVSPDKWQKALEGCGSGVASGGSGGGDGGTAQQNQDQQVKIAKCVRDKGFDMPDPKPGPNGSNSGFKVPEGADPGKFMKALNECAA
ncbi:hypothetical protein [Streptomyces sp. NBC_00859]|uniref:hypothetical protein n=1 Tax=Streptomyces sp. NBC_00859 TaxID=2903682 RepID=UPI00386F46A5|nr:hypothetical protein OG584_33825 [Streptomyces sp. NBC_00859]